MKTMNFKSILSIFCILICGSCSDSFLDRQPLDQVVSTNFYQTETDAMEALVAVYDVLGYQSTPGVGWAPFVTISDILSDDAHAGGADANDGMDEDECNKFQISTTSNIGHSIWLKNYTGIYRANLLLERIDDIQSTPEFKSRIIAEAKFLRAYFYFELVRFFENIPLLTETIKGPSEYSQTQNSPQEVYNQIALDLVESIADLPEDIPTNENGRVSSWASQALLARVYLFYNGVYGGDLQAGSITIGQGQIVDYLVDIINNSGHGLLPNYDDLFRLASEFSVESIFEISHGDSPAWWDWGYVRGGEGNLAAQMQGPRVTGSENWNRGWSFAPVTENLVKEIGSDPRASGIYLREGDLDGSLVKGYQHTGYFSKKYTSDFEHWGSDGQLEHNRICNFRVIRFADVLLMAAELGAPNAQSYMDQVRSRSGLASIPVTIDNIYKERRIEFALEGLRYFDILRRGMDYANDELTLQGERGSNYVGDQVIFDITFNPVTRGFLPIPQSEIDLSDGAFIQNPGY